mgnify:CR=1 FL=1
MSQQEVHEQNTIKVKYSTALILAGIIFLASLFSGWLTQNRDLSTFAADHKILSSTVAAAQKRPLGVRAS